MERSGTVGLVSFDFERELCSRLPHNKIILMMKCFLSDSQLVIGEMKPEWLTGINNNIRQLYHCTSFHPAVSSPELGTRSNRGESQIYRNLETLMNICVLESPSIHIHSNVWRVVLAKQTHKFLQKCHCHSNQWSVIMNILWCISAYLADKNR